MDEVKSSDSAPEPRFVSAEGEPMTTSEKAVLGGVFAVFTGVLGLLIWAGVKQDQLIAEEEQKRQEEVKRKREERNAWIEEQRKNGRIVLETQNGGYMSISAEAYAKAEVFSRDPSVD